MDELRMQGDTAREAVHGLTEARHGVVAHEAADDDTEARTNVVAHREHVVRRLLRLGLSERLLRRLLPEWSPLIERLATVEVRG